MSCDEDEDPYVPTPDQLSRLKRLEKMSELDSLKALVRMFLDAIDGVPMRALDCDQIWVEELWCLLREYSKKNRKKMPERRSR